MKKSKVYTDFKKKFPTLFRLVSASSETALEIKAKKGVLAFLNNAFNFGLVAGDLEKLVLESLEYQGKDHEAHKKNLFYAVKEEFKGENVGLISIITEHVAHLIFMNIGGGKALERAIVDYENEDKNV